MLKTQLIMNLLLVSMKVTSVWVVKKTATFFMRPSLTQEKLILLFQNVIKSAKKKPQPCLSSSVIGCAMTLDKQSIHIFISFSVFAIKTKSRLGVISVKQ